MVYRNVFFGLLVFSLMLSSTSVVFSQAEDCHPIITESVGDSNSISVDPKTVIIRCDHDFFPRDVFCVQIISPGYYNIYSGAIYSADQGNESFYLQLRLPDGSYAEQLDANAGPYRIIADTSYLPFSASRYSGKFYLTQGNYTLKLNHYYLIQNEFPGFLNPPERPMTGDDPESVHFNNFIFEYSGDAPKQYDLSISKFADKDSAKVEENILYRLQAENLGSDLATDVVLMDVLPEFAEIYDYSIKPDSTADRVVLWKIGSLAAGQNFAVAYSAQINQTLPDTVLSILNSAEVRAIDDISSDNNYADAVVYIKRDHIQPVINCDVHLQKFASADTVHQSESFQYILTVQNLGPTTAFEVTLVDTLPELITLSGVSITPDSTAKNLYFWFLDSLSVSEMRTITLEVKLFEQITNQVVSIKNSAFVDAANDTNLSNNYSNAVVTAIMQARPKPAFDLSLNKTASRDTMTAGEGFSYNLTIKNLGPVAAGNFSVTDTLPGLIESTNFSIEPDSVADQALFWFFDTLAVENMLTISFSNAVNYAGQDTIFDLKNTAWVHAEKDSNHSNDGSAVTVSVVAKKDIPKFYYDLSILKTADRDSIRSSGNLNYYLQAENLGPETAYAITLSDTVPEYITVAGSLPAPDSISENLLFWKIDSLQVNHKFTIQLTTIADAKFPEKKIQITNSALINAINDTNLVNNQASVTVLGIDESVPSSVNFDLVLSKTANKDTVFSGERMRYNLKLVNLGPVMATHVVLVDTLPALLTPLGFSRTPDSTTKNIYFWSFDTLFVGKEMSLSMSTVLNSTCKDSIKIFKNAACAIAVNDTNQNNNYAFAQSVAIIRAENPDKNYHLELTKTSDADSVEIGEEFHYEIKVKNLGPDVACDIALADSMPICIQVVDLNPLPDSVAGNVYYWNFASIQVGDEKIVTITALLTNDCADSTANLNNIVTILGSDDPNNIGQRARARIIIIENTDDPKLNYELQLTKTADKDTVAINESFVYEIKLENLGPGTAYNITVTDSLPGQLTYLNFVPQPDSAVNNVVFWKFDSLLLGQSKMMTYTAVYNQSKPDSNFALDNIVIVTAAGDTNLIGERNARKRIIIVEEKPPRLYYYNLGLTKEADKDTVSAGESFVYFLTVINYGPNTAYDITLVDSLPELITASDFYPDPDSVSGNLLFWFIDSLHAGEQVIVSFTATLERSLPKTIMPIMNVAGVMAPGDTNGVDNGDEAEIIGSQDEIIEDCVRSYYFDENLFEPDLGKSLSIFFSLKTTQLIRLDLYDISGYHITTLKEDFYNKGFNKFLWNGKIDNGQLVGSGVYIIALRAQYMNCWKKVIVVR